jgi:hypothetical protein
VGWVGVVGVCVGCVCCDGDDVDGDDDAVEVGCVCGDVLGTVWLGAVLGAV